MCKGLGSGRGAFLVLCLCLGAIGCAKFYGLEYGVKDIASYEPPLPQVRVDKGVLERHGARAERIWYCSDLAYGKLDSGSEVKVVAAGNYGVTIFKKDLQVAAQVSFEEQDWWKSLERKVSFGILERVSVVDADKDGECEYFSSYNHYGGPVVLLDHRGQLMWSTDDVFPVGGFRAAYGDLDGDGDVEFCVQRDYDSPYVALFDHKGTMLWAGDFAGGNNPETKLLGPTMPDLDDDGKAEIVGSDGKMLFVYDVMCNLTRSIFLPERYSLCLDGMRTLNDLVWNQDFVIAYENKLGWCVFPIEDQAEAIPLKTRVMHPPATARYVRFKQNESYLVVASGMTQADLAMEGFDTGGLLLVRDSHGELVYYEALPFHPEALCAIPSSDGTTEDLVIAGRKRVYRYTALKTSKTS